MPDYHPIDRTRVHYYAVNVNQDVHQMIQDVHAYLTARQAKRNRAQSMSNTLRYLIRLGYRKHRELHPEAGNDQDDVEIELVLLDSLKLD